MKEFEAIYTEYFTDVFVYIRRLAGDAQIAEEITAETFFKAMQALDGFKGKCDIRVWLCQIAKHCYFTYLRRNRRLVPADAAAELAEEHDLAQSLADAELTERIHGILHTLGEPYKEVFTLRVFGELKFKQIAKLFGKSENWACVTYHRARAAILLRLEAKK